MSTLLIIGVCLVFLGVGGRVAVGRGDASRRQSAIRAGNPEPRPSDGKKRAANAGTGAGILAIIAGLIFGGGSGLGFGPGTGVGSGGQVVESSVSAGDVETTYEEAVKEAQDTDTITIRVNKTDIYVNEYKCEDSDAFGKMVEDVYEDGMNITVVDDYADSEPYSAVTGYLRENAYEYRVEVK